MAILLHGHGDGMIFKLRTSFIGILVLVTLWRLYIGIVQPIAVWDEFTNAEVLRSTVEQQSFPVLYKDGLPFFEKPPLWYITNVALNTNSGISLLTMRLISVVSALGIIATCVLFVIKKSGVNAGLITWTALLLSHPLWMTNVGGYFHSHTLTSADPDSLQILFMLLTLIAIESKTKSAAVWSGIFTGLGILTKGPFALIPLVVATVTPRFFPMFKFKTAWLITMLVAIPWYGIMVALYGETFLRWNVGYHMALRAFAPLEGHEAPWWFYIQFLTNFRVYPIWPIIIFGGIYMREKIKKSKTLQHVGLIILTFLITSTLIETKLAWYILPIFPFLAIFVGLLTSPLRAHKADL